MLGKSSKNIIPNSGLMVIYHGRISKNHPKTNPRHLLRYATTNSVSYTKPKAKTAKTEAASARLSGKNPHNSHELQGETSSVSRRVILLPPTFAQTETNP